MDRRVVLTGLAAVVLLGAGGYGLRTLAASRYTAAAAAFRRPMNLAATGAERLAELVRMASLAPNSHNTQAWTVTPRPDGVLVAVDPARRTPVVDPDDHHLFVSLGAMVETLIIVATAYGITARPEIDAAGTVTLAFSEGALPSPLLAAVAMRQSHRGLHDGTPLTASDHAALLAADPGLRLIEGPPTVPALHDLTVAACATQMRDGDYRAELKSWLRFSEAAAMETGDGLFAGCSNRPALPQGLGRALFPLVVTADGEAATLRAQLASTPTLALFVTDPDTPVGRIETGRRLQRVSLAATRAGLSAAHVNPALETPEGRTEVARLCGIVAGRPSILLRLGRSASPLPFSLRRPPSQAILS